MLAPHAKLRAAVVPGPLGNTSEPAHEHTHGTQARIGWARLLKRVFDIDIEHCLSKVRNNAAKRGLSPDQCFNNVELVVAEKIGMETTTYVRNIYKYYVAYRLIADA